MEGGVNGEGGAYGSLPQWGVRVLCSHRRPLPVLNTAKSPSGEHGPPPGAPPGPPLDPLLDPLLDPPRTPPGPPTGLPPGPPLDPLLCGNKAKRTRCHDGEPGPAQQGGRSQARPPPANRAELGRPSRSGTLLWSPREENQPESHTRDWDLTRNLVQQTRRTSRSSNNGLWCLH